MTTVSSIIVTYNSADVICECLQALVQIAETTSLEIIVVDNASTDETTEIVSQEFPSVKLVETGENLGYGGGNNRGANVSTGDYIAIVNPDLIIDADPLNKMVDYLANNTDVGVVGPKTLSGDGSIAISANPPYTARRSVAKYLGLERLFPQWVYGDYYDRLQASELPFEADWLGGACLVFPRETYQQLNGFDEDFFLFVEDVDICERAWRLGWKVIYMPMATVKHYHSTSVDKARLISTHHYHISPLLYFRKRNRHQTVRLVKCGYTVELLIKVIKRLIKGLFRRNKEALTDARIHWKVLGAVLRY
jgi:N-acetylglucosaminyl-diphospho-decaprenol L-rhamnosyltransferase